MNPVCFDAYLPRGEPQRGGGSGSFSDTGALSEWPTIRPVVQVNASASGRIYPQLMMRRGFSHNCREPGTDFIAQRPLRRMVSDNPAFQPRLLPNGYKPPPNCPVQPSGSQGCQRSASPVGMEGHAHRFIHREGLAQQDARFRCVSGGIPVEQHGRVPFSCHGLGDAIRSRVGLVDCGQMMLFGCGPIARACGCDAGSGAKEGQLKRRPCAGQEHLLRERP